MRRVNSFMPMNHEWLLEQPARLVQDVSQSAGHWQRPVDREVSSGKP